MPSEHHQLPIHGAKIPMSIQSRFSERNNIGASRQLTNLSPIARLSFVRVIGVNPNRRPYCFKTVCNFDGLPTRFQVRCDTHDLLHSRLAGLRDVGVQTVDQLLILQVCVCVEKLHGEERIAELRRTDEPQCTRTIVCDNGGDSRK